MPPLSSSSSRNPRSRGQGETTRNTSSNAQQLPISLQNLSTQETPYISPYSPIPTQAQATATTIFSPQPTQPARSGLNPLLSDAFPTEYQPPTAAMSTYSSSSQDSIYSSPGPRQYAVVTPGMMSNPQSISAVSEVRVSSCRPCIFNVYILSRTLIGILTPSPDIHTPVRIDPSALGMRHNQHVERHTAGLLTTSDGYLSC